MALENWRPEAGVQSEMPASPWYFSLCDECKSQLFELV